IPRRANEKSRHLQEQGCGKETRTRGSVFQTALELVLRVLYSPACGRFVSMIFPKPKAFFAGLINPPCPGLYCVVMIQGRFSLRYAVWIMISVTAGYEATQVLAESLLAQQTQPTLPATTATQSPTVAPVSPSPQATPGQTSSSELGNLEAKVRPSVIWVTTFDPKGNLLRTESGFFISADGRFVTTAHAVEGGVNAVAKTADGGIYNVSGLLALSRSSDL